MRGAVGVWAGAGGGGGAAPCVYFRPQPRGCPGRCRPPRWAAARRRRRGGRSGSALNPYVSVPGGVLPPEPVRGCLGDPAPTAAQTSRERSIRRENKALPWLVEAGGRGWLQAEGKNTSVYIQRVFGSGFCCHKELKHSSPFRQKVDMDDEDGRCLLDVICDPQALNDFLHGSEKIDSDDLLDNTGDAASAFFEGAGLHVQEASGNHLSAEPQPAPHQRGPGLFRR
ncbi:uncharacterized protein BICRA [Falco cherrug]|uniref:uncharacterized protein BICRA n=1 Tax=Falco cherrug TaxID=345164 RepID=UPI00247A9A44|nr:uncharacterized protein BICRA [Falco cherrug]